MARVFAITTAATSFRLDAQGRAETSFTVSNASGRALRGRAEVRATDAAQQGWLSVVGDGERDFPANGTHQIAVKVAAPPGSPAGKFSFRLDMVSAQNPDEDFAEYELGEAEIADLRRWVTGWYDDLARRLAAELAGEFPDDL